MNALPLLLTIVVVGLPGTDPWIDISSDNPAIRHRAYERIAHEGQLTKAEAKKILAATARTEAVTGRPRPEGPETIATDGIRILERHPFDVRAVLIESLNSDDWNVRRYSAYTLGAIGDKRAIKPLATAISAEVQRASRIRIKVGSWPRTPLLAPLREMFVALAALDCTVAIDTASQLLNSSDSFSVYAAAYALERIIKNSPVAAPPYRPGINMTDAKGAWREWLNAHPHVAPECRH